MRTKTLLLTAMLGVASIVAAIAQTTPVYSVNAVGYINVPVPKGFSMIANQLIAADMKISALFPNVPGGTTIYKFNNQKGSYEINSYDSDFKEWSDANMTLVPGEGAFILNASTAAFTVTFVGEVPQGDVSLDVPVGFSIISSKVPQAGELESLAYTPEGGDTIYRYDNAASGYIISNYDADFNEWDKKPAVNVGEGFFIKKAKAGKWTRNFSVN